ncbi:flippase-like domain-containing protein [candidate division KSB1 bacterium]|nr:flippase-like domain-containing protein [candidate division KSB1 bacterium]
MGNFHILIDYEIINIGHIVKKTGKILIGFLFSIVFLYLAFRKIEFSLMMRSLMGGKYMIALPAIGAIFISHFVRAIRWQYFLEPVKKVALSRLFSALMVGYFGNSVLPAHLGEFFRAFVIGRKEKIPASSVFATIVLERIIDLFTLLVIMVAVLIIYPFPDWLKDGIYILCLITVLLFLFLIFLKKYSATANRVFDSLLKFIPERFSLKIKLMLKSFTDGIRAFKRKRDYAIVIIHTLIIWACYTFVLYIGFYIFDLVSLFNLSILSATVLMVITTIGVIIPTSPGYIGTYHLLSQMGLELLGVPRSLGLTYAIAVHAINFFPVIVVGLIYTWNEGINLAKISKSRELKKFILEG